MKKQVSINTQLIITMSLVCFAVIASAFLSAYLVYLVFYPDPEAIEAAQEDSYFEFADFIWILLMALIGLMTSILLAFRISKKMMLSINALAEASQSIMDGNLSTRVQRNPKTNFAELIQLEENFNLMAEQLENKQNNIMLWNAGIAHELRTPVTILKGRLQGILDGIFIPNDELVTTLLKQTENLSVLIEDLRLLSLIENNHLKLTLEPTDLRLLLEDKLVEYTSEFEKYDLEIVSSLVTGKVMCDRFRLQQVFTALLDNAIRYANPGRLYLSSQIQNDQWQFIIEDEGPGISEEAQAHIFESFYRANHPSRESKQGTGLGLTIIKHLIEAHKGSITYEKSRHGGSCFKVQLPL